MTRLDNLRLPQLLRWQFFVFPYFIEKWLSFPFPVWLALLFIERVQPLLVCRPLMAADCKLGKVFYIRLSKLYLFEFFIFLSQVSS